MSVLGIRCSNKDYSFAVLEGKPKKPRVLHTGCVAFPKGYSPVQQASWFLQEIEALIDQHDVRDVVIKGFEGMNRGKTFVERVEHEAVLYLAAANKGIKGVVRKVKSTIAKDLGLKGRGRYLSTALDTTVIPGYDALPEKTREALLASWSGLR